MKNEDIKDKDIKQRIKDLIAENGHTITSIAEKMGVSRNNLSVVLNSKEGHVSASLIRGMAEMGWDLNYIFRGEKIGGGEEKWKAEREKLLYHLERLETLLMKGGRNKI